MATTFITTPPVTNSRPHPCLQEPILYLSNLPLDVSEADLASAFMYCVPFRPQIHRDELGQSLGGATIMFKHIESAEKALATLQQRPLPNHPAALLTLSPWPQTIPPTPMPPPEAHPRMVKHLPPHYTDSQLYDLFRPFGALASVRTSTGYGPGTSLVEFCYEDEALIAQEAMHCVEVEGQTISVQVFQPRRVSGQYKEFSPEAPAFVPSGMIAPGFSPRAMPQAQTFATSSSFIHGPGQQVQLAPTTGPGASHSGLIDPCNLFIKNLDTDIDSNLLFGHFREFGQIVSARVMRNEQGTSRGFGFVSYQTPDQAARAMHTMNGVTLGMKQIIVRLHEPKQLRQEKLAQRFGGHNNHPRSASGATSPTLSEGNDSFTGWPSPGRAHPGLTSSSPPNERVRRSSGSYYHAALSGTLNLPMRYEELSTLSPVVRKEVLSGELNRRIKDLEGVTLRDEEVDSVVESIVNMNLNDVVEVLQDQSKLSEQVKTVQGLAGNGSTSLAPEQSLSASPSPARSVDSTLLDPQALIATASAPEHPSTPVSFSGSLSDPPRTASPSTSIPVHSDRQRLLGEVVKLEPRLAEEITNLLMSLSKRERALCLFSSEILKQKVAAAREIVALETEDDEPAPVTFPVTPVAKKTTSVPTDSSPRTPDPGSRATSAPAPNTPSQARVEDGHTLASLAQLPAEESVKILAAPAILTSLGLPPPDNLVSKSTDEFIDSLQPQSKAQQKQALGEKLFKFVKAAGGAKNAGKITIALLDSEDLRSLAHLMNSYPPVLKEKITIVSKTLPAK